MVPRFYLAAFALAITPLATPQVIPGGTGGVWEKGASTSMGSTLTPMRQKAAALVRQDLARAIGSGEPSNLQPASDPGAGAIEAITMAPFIVAEDQPVTLPPPEKPIDQFFRTGSLIERKGPKVTTRLWMKGDKGLMLSFDF